MKTETTLTTWLVQARTLEELERAYRALARAFHPDTNPGDAEATRRMQEINLEFEARKELLKSPQPRPKFQEPEPARRWTPPTDNISFEARRAFIEARQLYEEFDHLIISIDDGEVIAGGPGSFHAREKLKQIGFWFDGDRKLWHFVRRPQAYSKNRKGVA